VRVPYRWLRAFGQVQAASTLPAERVSLAPVDLYNVLLSLRLRKAKTAPRALRYELVPGQPPRLVLEPWEQVLPQAVSGQRSAGGAHLGTATSELAGPVAAAYPGGGRAFAGRGAARVLRAGFGCPRSTCWIWGRPP